MWIHAPLLLALSLAPAAAAQAEEPAPAATATSQSDEEQRDVYQDLLRRYNNEIGAHRFDCQQLRHQGVPEDRWPPSPLYTWFPRFVELADSGNGWAQYWVSANTVNVLEDPAARREVLERMFTRLVREHAGAPYALDVVDELARSWKLLGEEQVRGYLRALQENSGVAEVEARALLGEADLYWKNGHPDDDEAAAAAVDRWQVLVDGYAGTKAAREAAFHVLARTDAAMQRAQRAWVATVRGLRAQGIGEEGWPDYPLDAFRGQYAALAATGQEVAAYVSDVFFPGYEQARREGVVPTLRFVARDLGARYLVSETRWMDVRFDVLGLLFEAWTDEPWIYEELVGLESGVERFDPAAFVPLMESLIARTSDERTRYQARLYLARNLEHVGSFAALERALALCDDVAQHAPIERQRKEAELARRELSWVMPGASLPAFKALDAEKATVESANYRGKVFVLFFWGFWCPESVAQLPWVNELVEAYANEPVAVLGFNTDLISYKLFHQRATQERIAWRNVLETKRTGVHASMLRVLTFPTTIVVDGEGVIRGRNLEPAATRALIDALLAERRAGTSDAPGVGEAASPPPSDVPAAAPDSGLRGRVVFDGPREPLPPLRFSAEQTKGCCAAGHQVDTTDRRRLVDAAGGLANVVVWVDVEGAAVDGRGREVVLDQFECRFEPHVSVVPLGAKLVLKNSDGVSHNVNLTSRYNGSMNEIMPAGTRRELEFKRADKVGIGCDLHPWMDCWVFVVDTPYWALTAADGTFAIPNLPPGEYVARCWHEQLGEVTSARFSVTAGAATALELEMAEKASRGRARRPR